MSDTSNEGRTHSIHGIHHGRFWSDETQRANLCIKDSWFLHGYVEALKNSGNLTSESLSEFFRLAAETMNEIGAKFDDDDIMNIDWDELTALYTEA